MNRLRIIFFQILLLVLFSSELSSQDSVPLKYRSPLNFFLEVGGNGGLYSINHERTLLLLTSRSHLNWTIGFSAVPLNGRAVVDIPLSINYSHVTGQSQQAEIGTGQVLILDIGGGKGGTVRGTFRLGYRLGWKKHYWKFAYTPFYSYIYNFQFEHWFGISYGRYFKR